MRPGVEERSVPRAGGAGGKIVNIARMPFRGRGDLGIRAPAILVDARHHPMIAILEAHVDRIDLVSGNQRSIEQVRALFTPEERRIGTSHARKQPKRSHHRIYEIFGVLDADLHRLGDRLIKRHGDCRSVFLIIVEHNENEDRYGETDKKNSHHGAQLGSPQPRH